MSEIAHDGNLTLPSRVLLAASESTNRRDRMCAVAESSHDSTENNRTVPEATPPSHWELIWSVCRGHKLSLV
eukprot:747284-Hanusia_phi.AAC.1